MELLEIPLKEKVKRNNIYKNQLETIMNNNNDIEYNDTPEEDRRKKIMKKRQLILALLGLIVIILSIILAGVLTGIDNSKKSDESVENKIAYEADSTHIESEWKEFNGRLDYDTYKIDDLFTVNSIKSYYKSNQVIYVVSGKLKNMGISNVDLILSPQYAKVLNVNDSFKVKISYINIDSESIIVDVEYQIVCIYLSFCEFSQKIFLKFCLKLLTNDVICGIIVMLKV